MGFNSLFHRTTETLVSVAHRLEISRTRPPKLKLPWPSGFQDHPSTSKDLTGKMSKKITTAGESNKVMADQAEEKFEKIRVGSEDRRSVKNRYRQDAGGPFGQGRGPVEGNEQGDRCRC